MYQRVMIGGPWLLNGTHKANGNISKGNSDETNSPYYTTKIMEDMIKFLKDEKNPVGY